MGYYIIYVFDVLYYAEQRRVIAVSGKVNKKKRRRSPAFVAGLVILFLGIVILISLAMFVSFDEVTNVFEAGKVDIVLTEPDWKPQDGENIVPNEFVKKDPTVINKEETVNTYVFLKVTVPYDDDPNLKIEYAHQKDATHSGETIYTNTSRLKIPVYEFVATGKKAGDTDEGERKYNQDFLTTFTPENANKQEVNPGWYLLKGFPEIDEQKKTYTYLYAHVRTVENDVMMVDGAGHKVMAEVIAKQPVAYPLFNEIYLNNFRERAEDTNAALPVTAFPDPARNYSIHIEAYGIQANFLKPNNTTTTIPEEVWPYIDSNYTYNSATGEMKKNTTQP